jgi:hypothetical protein
MISGECALTERQTIPARVFKLGSELLHTAVVAKNVSELGTEKGSDLNI